ncbi:unnamed protein product, partial [Nesidiocoris tenuis]
MEDDTAIDRGMHKSTLSYSLFLRMNGVWIVQNRNFSHETKKPIKTNPLHAVPFQHAPYSSLAFLLAEQDSPENQIQFINFSIKKAAERSVTITPIAHDIREDRKNRPAGHERKKALVHSVQEIFGLKLPGIHGGAYGHKSSIVEVFEKITRLENCLKNHLDAQSS